MKTLADISWKTDEETYRADPALSYSTIARYAREGFDNIDTLFDKIETPSLTFGSAVDSIITGGKEEFEKNFFVAEFPSIPESVERMVKLLFEDFHTSCHSISEIPDDDIISRTETLKYQPNWKPSTRAKVIKEQGCEYYSLLYLSQGKKIVNTEFYNEVNSCVTSLRTSQSTKRFFNPFDTQYERFYQLKFKATLDNVDYRCMADLILVDHNLKTIYPVDLKTSGHPEWDFFDSFVKWRYKKNTYFLGDTKNYLYLCMEK